MCSKCQACRSCGKDDLVKFVGNMIFCNTCIKVRRKESSCPVCELDYTDVDRVVQVSLFYFFCLNGYYTDFR